MENSDLKKAKEALRIENEKSNKKNAEKVKKAAKMPDPKPFNIEKEEDFSAAFDLFIPKDIKEQEEEKEDSQIEDLKKPAFDTKGRRLPKGLTGLLESNARAGWKPRKLTRRKPRSSVTTIPLETDNPQIVTLKIGEYEIRCIVSVKRV